MRWFVYQGFPTCHCLFVAMLLANSPIAKSDTINIGANTSWRAIAPEGNREGTPIASVGLEWEADNIGWNDSFRYNDSTASGWGNARPAGSGTITNPIWGNGEDTPVYFRKEFSISGFPTVGNLLVGVDDDAQVFVNGQQVWYDQNNRANDRHRIDVSDVLQPGLNLIAVKAHDSYRHGQAFGASLDVTVSSVPPPPEPQLPTSTGFNFLQRPAGSTAQNAIVLVHGWRDSPELFTTDNPSDLENTSLANAIKERLGSREFTEYDVIVWDWEEHAADAAWKFAPATKTRINAATQGSFLAKELINNGYSDRIHLVGHSLGGRVIESATRDLRDAENWDGEIHQTFLDAYTPLFWDSWFGAEADWADHYVHNIFGPLDGPIIDVDESIRHAINVDVTGIIDQDGIRSQDHKWPVRYYEHTVRHPGTGYGYGFDLAQEASPHLVWPQQIELQRGERVYLPCDVGCTEHWHNPIPLRSPVEPDIALLTRSFPGNVVVDANSIVLQTSSPAWASFGLTEELPIGGVEFDLEFLSDADGILSFFVDGELQELRYEQFSPHVSIHSVAVYFDEAMPAGNHVISFRLDNQSVNASEVRISSLAVLSVAIPEPCSLSIAVLSLFVLVVHRTRPGHEHHNRP